MVTPNAAGPVLRRAVLLMTASSFIVPAVGLLTQPILAQGLGVTGRGELAAAIAPAALAVSVATFGLPEAATYYVARHPSISRRALLWSSAISAALGALCVLAALWALPFISTGDAELGHYILLATALAIPALVIGAFRGVAAGRQMWGTIAIERLVNASLRLLALGSLWMLQELTVLNAVLVSCLTPVVAGVVYVGLLRRPPPDPVEQPFTGWVPGLLVSYGSKVWLGAVASMLLARSGDVLMAPLSSVEDLGLYSVANTIADVPLIVAVAIAGAVHGVGSKTNDPDKVTTTARIALLVGFLGCAALGAAAPFLIQPLFGAEFAAATIPTLLQLLSAAICIPGLIAASGLAAWGRPGLRSIALGLTLVAYVTSFVLLVPHFGVIGACWTGIAGNIVMTSLMVLIASRVMKVPARSFLAVRRDDVVKTWSEGMKLVRRATRSHSAR